MSIEVSGLSYYPIKSCAGISTDSLEVTETGFEYDRNWMVVDSYGNFMSQRKNPEMALIEPRILDSTLSVTAPHMEEFSFPINWFAGIEPVVDVTVHKKPVKARSEGDEAAEWFSEFLKTDAKLVTLVPGLPRQITDRYHKDNGSNQVGFADSFPFLMTSEASLAELNAHLTEPVAMNRFRPNIVVSGSDLEAYDEDFWREIRIGHMRAFVVRACDRCPVPDTNQTTGLRPDRPVTAALRETRHGTDPSDPKNPQGNFFGQNLNHVYDSKHPYYVFDEERIIELGDEIVIINRSDERNFIT